MLEPSSEAPAPVVSPPRPPSTLSEEQERAIDGILAALKRKQWQITLGGYAGTGKTTLIRHLIRELGAQWKCCAYTGKAASTLRRKGIADASTIHSLLYLPYEEDPYKENVTILYRLRDSLECQGIIVDEASMVGSDLHADLTSFGKPIIFVGDHGQLEPVGSRLNLMADPEFRLETIHRNAGDIAAFAESLRKGTRWTGHSDQVEVYSKSAVSLSAMAEADQVICAFNRSRVRLNHLIRKERGLPEELAVTDRVMCLRNNRQLGLYNGQQGTVTALHHVRASHYLDFECDGVPYPKVWYDPAQVGAERLLNQGRLNVETPMPFDWAYCVTCHKAQSDEWDTVLVVEQRCDAWEHRRWAYTAASRARKKLIWVRDIA